VPTTAISQQQSIHLMSMHVQEIQVMVSLEDGFSHHCFCSAELSCVQLRWRPARVCVTGCSSVLSSGALSAFNEPGLLGDLLDHWTASDHVQERQSMVRRLQVGTNTLIISTNWALHAGPVATACMCPLVMPGA